MVGVLSLLAMTNSAFMMVETHPRMRKRAKQLKQAPEAASGGRKGPISVFAKSNQLLEGDQQAYSLDWLPSLLFAQLCTSDAALQIPKYIACG